MSEFLTSVVVVDAMYNLIAERPLNALDRPVNEDGVATDVSAYEVLRDYYDDMNDGQRAAFYQWMLTKRQCAYKSKNTYVWFNLAKVHKDLAEPESNIEENIWESLEGGTTSANHKVYQTAKEADEALFKSWLKHGMPTA